MPSTSPSSPVNPNDRGRGPAILGVAWALTIVCLIFTGVRIYIRRRAPSVLGWDDWLIVVAALIQIVHTGFVTEACHWGAGMHDADLTPTQEINILKWFWISTTPALLVSIISRISAAILLIRIFGKKIWFKWYLIICTALQILSGIIAIIFIWIQQAPIESVWNPMIKPTHKRPAHLNDYSAYLAQALFAFADLSYVILPVWIIWRLNMSLRTKVGLGIILGLSCISFVGSVMKAVTSSEAKTEYASSLVILWSALEQTLVIIISCVPAIRHVVLAEIPLVKLISASIVRMISRDSSRKSSALSLPHSAHSQYQDLEASGGKLPLQSLSVSEDTVAHKATHEGGGKMGIEMKNFT
ncbi:uncharacterized protein F4807DRAFT_456276 [Annulohypoxylon truncatum]|uniref:uncharacterized protein n=1 Tax=Annulohypoxylon truncatum TaxID=327061 RepID=UPI00200873E3|nr:uncharacterized protein F4807DRAFT_456276 [Annulohypoxylon truncatum]KAI1213729.1 hypothetical protein F4807DRAFT_456276 [Annulohypoxylon truncatum]